MSNQDNEWKACKESHGIQHNSYEIIAIVEEIAV